MKFNFLPKNLNLYIWPLLHKTSVIANFDKCCHSVF